MKYLKLLVALIFIAAPAMSEESPRSALTVVNPQEPPEYTAHMAQKKANRLKNMDEKSAKENSLKYSEWLKTKKLNNQPPKEN